VHGESPQVGAEVVAVVEDGGAGFDAGEDGAKGRVEADVWVCPVLQRID